MLQGLPLIVKFLIAAIYDFLDLFSIPGIGSLYDIIGIPLGVALWGPMGFIQVWEVVDITDQFDKFVPTMVLAGILTYIRGH